MRRAGLLVLVAAASVALPTRAPAQALHLLVVSGLSGEASYASSFATAAGTLVDVARTRWGAEPASAVWLGEAMASPPPTFAGVATREAVAAAFDSLARRSAPGDVVLVVLIGHGSGEGEGSRLSLPGMDPTAADYRRWLGGLLDRTVVFVNTASASGDFLPVLAGRNRVVITSTRSATERNASTFATHFVHGIASGEADADKNGTLTVLEAYDYARRAVQEAYEGTNRLLTEHAQLDDNGDGEGTADPTLPTSRDGTLATRLVLGSRAVPTDPRVLVLLDERRKLEGQVEALRLRRDALTAEAYAEELESLLVAIAERTRAIRRLEGGEAP